MKTIGVFVGRLQGLTTGHLKVINIMSKSHLKSYVVVIRGTKSCTDAMVNPFPYEIQDRMIKRVLPSNVELIQINSLDDLERFKGKKFTLYSGPDRYRGYQRYAKNVNTEGYKVKVVNTSCNVPRNDNISGTKFRQSLKDNNIDMFKTIAPEEIWDMFEELREYIY
jgi:hypothetical protein